MDPKPDAPVPPVPQPEEDKPPHVNAINHQFYNIYRRKMAHSLSRVPTQQQTRQYSKLDLSRLNDKYNPLTRIKPLKPSPLDIYDTQITQQRKKAQGSNTWVIVRAYS